MAVSVVSDSLRAFAPRPILLIAADKDAIFPPSHYADSIARLANVQLISNEESDHGFSACRPAGANRDRLAGRRLFRRVVYVALNDALKNGNQTGFTWLLRI